MPKTDRIVHITVDKAARVMCAQAHTVPEPPCKTHIKQAQQLVNWANEGR